VLRAPFPQAAIHIEPEEVVFSREFWNDEEKEMNSSRKATPPMGSVE